MQLSFGHAEHKARISPATIFLSYPEAAVQLVSHSKPPQLAEVTQS